MSIKVFENTMDDYFDQFTLIISIKLPGFAILLLLIHVIIFIPLMNQFRAGIWITQSELNLIPSKLIMGNKALKDYILKNRI